MKFLNYWQDEDTFIRHPVDWSLGYVKRTPDNDERNTPEHPLHVTSIVVDMIK